MITPWTRTVALLGGAGVGAAVIGGRLGGVLEGPVAVVLAAVLILAVPTSRLLARRALLAAGVLAGLLPALWWWDLPLGPLGRVTPLLAVLAGGLTTAALWGGPAAARARVRAALPRWRRVDLVVLGAGVGGTLAALPWLGVATGASAIGRLLPGWDNSAHLAMTLGLRRHGVITLLADAAPAGEAWKFTEYPQGFHATIAAGIEVLTGAGLGPLDQEVTAYVRAQGLVVIGIAVLIAAGLAQLPIANRRPGRTAVVTAGAVAAFVAGPGGDAIAHGFGNFVLAAAFVAGALLLAIPLPRLTLPVPVAALAGFVIGIAHGWVLLLLIALPAVLLALVPPRPRTWRTLWRGSPGDLALLALIVVAALAGVGQAIRIVSVLDAGEVLAIAGGITLPPAGLLLAVVAAAFAAALWPGVARPARVTWAAAVPAVGGLAVLGVGALQSSGGADLSYYFWKLAFGLVLVCVVVLAVGVLWGPPGPPRPRGAAGLTLGVVATGALMLAVTQVFGLTRGPGPVSPHDAAAGAQLLRAVAAGEAAAGAPGPVVHVTADALHPVNRQQWFLALRGTWTVEANEATTVLLDANGFPRPVPEAVAEILADPAGPRLAVPAADLPVVAPDVEDDRVISW